MENKRLHALLVEDNLISMDIAKEILVSEGFTVDIAWNGLEAVEHVELAEEGTYDLVFMDLQMPYMSGYEATRQIRAIARMDAKKIPIIALSAEQGESEARDSMLCGMNQCLQKPLTACMVRKIKDAWL